MYQLSINQPFSFDASKVFLALVDTTWYPFIIPGCSQVSATNVYPDADGASFTADIVCSISAVTRYDVKIKMQASFARKQFSLDVLEGPIKAKFDFAVESLDSGCNLAISGDYQTNPLIHNIIKGSIPSVQEKIAKAVEARVQQLEHVLG